MTSRPRSSRPSPSSQKRKRRGGSPRTARPPRPVALAELKDNLSHYRRRAAENEIVITSHGKPAGVLIGFNSEEDWFDHQLEHNPDFLARVAAARDTLRRGRGVRLEDDFVTKCARSRLAVRGGEG